jgi:hypothetical protein
VEQAMQVFFQVESFVKRMSKSRRALVQGKVREDYQKQCAMYFAVARESFAHSVKSD